jgi:predicted SnoaL-like aldol condensation-catalyzing enzyme
VDDSGKIQHVEETDAAHDDVRPPNFEFSVTRVLQDGDAIFVKAVHEPASGEGASWLAMSLIRADTSGLMSVRRQISARYLQSDCLCSSLAACALPNGPKSETGASKALVRGFVDIVLEHDYRARLGEFIDREVFVSHTPAGCSRPDRIEDFIARRRSRPGLRYHGIDDLVGEGSFVALFSCFDIEGTHYRACDLFRVAGGRIVEHWDVIEAVPAHTVAHNDQA